MKNWNTNVQIPESNENFLTQIANIEWSCSTDIVLNGETYTASISDVLNLPFSEISCFFQFTNGADFKTLLDTKLNVADIEAQLDIKIQEQINNT